MSKDKLDSVPQTASYVMSLPQPPLRNAEEYLKAYTGYVYTAVSSIAQEVASIDLHLFKASFSGGKPETTEIYEHEALSLLRYTNQISTFYDLVEATQVYCELTGEAFWVVLKKGDKPREIWPLRPDWVSIIPDPVNVIKEYRYNPGGNTVDSIAIPKDNMLHFKYFHPLNPYRGKGTVQSAALPFDILNFAQEYNRNFFFNSAIPSMVFTTEQKISEATVKRFVNQWQASYGGRSKSNKIAFLGNGMKIDKLTVGAKELDFNAQQRQLRDDILAVFKVPKTILGLTDDVNRANAEATTMAFMERVITPRMRKFVDVLNEMYLPMFKDTENMFLDFNDPSPEDEEMKLKKYENALQYGWMTPNEVRAEENLEPLAGGDELPTKNPKSGDSSNNTDDTTDDTTDENSDEKPTDDEESKGLFSALSRVFSKKELKKVKVKRVIKKKPIKHMVRIPAKRLEQFDREELAKDFVEPLTKFIGDMLQVDKYNLNRVKKKEDKIAKELPKEESIKEEVVEESSQTDELLFTEEKKLAYWRQFISHVTEREKDLKKHAIHLFGEQEKMVIEKLEKNVKQLSKKINKETASSVLPTLEQLSLIWLRVWEEEMKEVLLDQGNYTLDFLGVGGTLDLTTDTAVAFLHEFGGKLINEISETTRSSLVDTLAEGFAAGEGIVPLRNRVSAIFETATKSRAEMIARTESLRASNIATVEAYRQSGIVTGKEWLSERDLKTCPICQDMDGETIGLNKNYFMAGDTLEQTNTVLAFDVGEPPLHPNCYSKDTEVYTKAGWKLIKDVEKEEIVLTLNPNTLQLEESAVSKTINFEVSSVYHLTNKQHSVDLMVSKDHPFIGFKRIDRGKKGRKVEFIKYEKLDDISKEEFRFYTSSEWRGKILEEIKIGSKLFKTEDWCKFLGYYLSEGSVTKRKDKDHYQISIAQSKYLEEMYEDISVMPFNKICLGKDKIYIFDKEIALYLIQFGKSDKKYIPDNIKSLDQKYIRIFLDAYLLGDGSRKKGKKWKDGKFKDSLAYFTSSKKMAGDLGELIIKCGKSISFAVDKTKGKEVHFKNGTYKINNDCIRIYELTSQFKMFKNIIVKEIKYDDYVYDLEVKKNHTLLVRRNGKVIWGSNCRCTTIPVLTGTTSTQTDVPIKIKASELVIKAKLQDDDFQDDVNSIAKLVDGDVRSGPVKTIERIIEKINIELSDVKNPFNELRDTNRATILIKDPKDLNKIIAAVEAKYGSTERVLNKFDYPVGSYRSAIINVSGSQDVIAEIAVTTPEMWDARMIGGGDALYKKVRSKKDPTGKFLDKMAKLYTDADTAVANRLKKFIATLRRIFKIS